MRVIRTFLLATLVAVVFAGTLRADAAGEAALARVVTAINGLKAFSVHSEAWLPDSQGKEHQVNLDIRANRQGKDTTLGLDARLPLEPGKSLDLQVTKLESRLFLNLAIPGAPQPVAFFLDLSQARQMAAGIPGMPQGAPAATEPPPAPMTTADALKLITAKLQEAKATVTVEDNRIVVQKPPAPPEAAAPAFGGFPGAGAASSAPDKVTIGVDATTGLPAEVHAFRAEKKVARIVFSKWVTTGPVNVTVPLPKESYQPFQMTHLAAVIGPVMQSFARQQPAPGQSGANPLAALLGGMGQPGTAQPGANPLAGLLGDTGQPGAVRPGTTQPGANPLAALLGAMKPAPGTGATGAGPMAGFLGGMKPPAVAEVPGAAPVQPPSTFAPQNPLDQMGRFQKLMQDPEYLDGMRLMQEGTGKMQEALKRHGLMNQPAFDHPQEPPPGEEGSESGEEEGEGDDGGDGEGAH